MWYLGIFALGSVLVPFMLSGEIQLFTRTQIMTLAATSILLNQLLLFGGAAPTVLTAQSFSRAYESHKWPHTEEELGKGRRRHG